MHVYWQGKRVVNTLRCFIFSDWEPPPYLDSIWNFSLLQKCATNPQPPSLHPWLIFPISYSLFVFLATVLESHASHFPWGLPESKGKDTDETIILTQKHYVTGYQTSLCLPSWVGYKLTKEVPFYVQICFYLETKRLFKFITFSFWLMELWIQTRGVFRALPKIYGGTFYDGIFAEIFLTESWIHLCRQWRVTASHYNFNLPFAWYLLATRNKRTKTKLLQARCSPSRKWQLAMSRLWIFRIWSRTHGTERYSHNQIVINTKRRVYLEVIAFIFTQNLLVFRCFWTIFCVENNSFPFEQMSKFCMKAFFKVSNNSSFEQNEFVSIYPKFLLKCF